MSANNVFQRAFQHAQLTRPSDHYRFSQGAPSPAKVPKNPENHCRLCLRDPQSKHKAGTHFLRECPLLPQNERDYLRRIFEKALQKRTLPRDKWPKKIYDPSGTRGQSFNLKLINMVEDYYDLDMTSHDAVGSIETDTQAYQKNKLEGHPKHEPELRPELQIGQNNSLPPTH